MSINNSDNETKTVAVSDTTSASKLTNDQLLTYIKKQSAIIKRLEKEKAAFQSSSCSLIVSTCNSNKETTSNGGGDLFWSLIGRGNKFHQNLALSALNSLVSVLSSSDVANCGRCLNRKQAFKRWKSFIINSNLINHESVVAETSKTIGTNLASLTNDEFYYFLIIFPKSLPPYLLSCIGTTQRQIKGAFSQNSSSQSTQH